ncbi:MAG: glycoside hydrolase family 88 protein [Akkermansiaceae bacterium]|jgi:unsaturated chondroitin disaccharide hydrolase|nr:glycoside hydrolase family 88 protein [Akkermansiaceae bacterium]
MQTTISPASARPQNSSYEEAFEVIAAKTLRNLPDLAAGGRTWSFDKNGAYEEWNEGFFEIGNWTTGFFTGMGLLAYLRSKDAAYLRAMEGMERHYQRKVEEGAGDTMHDLGFLYSPYAVGLSILTGESRFRDMGLKAAGLLEQRFIESGSYIRAWGRMDETGPEYDYDGLAIIDCMMNLPLLFWAARESGNRRFHEVAVRHADTTLQHFIRADGSVYHSFRFHPDGRPKGPDNYCGRGVETHWARGAGWAMYGFALAYRHTGDTRYREASLKVSRAWLALLDEEMVPVWDFRLPAGEDKLRDSSAAAIAVCAIQELDDAGLADEAMLAAKKALLERLCSPDYFDARPEVRGVLRFGEVGNGVGKARSAYTSWGDYYLMEALGREMGLEIPWW